MGDGDGFYCLDNNIPTDIFFPKSYTRESCAEAISMCRKCDRETECLEIALKFKLEEGIYGGMRPRDRDRYLVREASRAARAYVEQRNTLRVQQHPVYEFPAFPSYTPSGQNHSPLVSQSVAGESPSFQLKLPTSV